MLVACSRCGKIHERGLECSTNYKPVKRERKPSEEVKLRNKSKWAKKSKYIREISYNLCAICKEEGDYSYKLLEVHHIDPLREVGRDGLLEDSNLISLCTYHHKLADKNYISRSYLKELVNMREKKEKDNPPGI